MTAVDFLHVFSTFLDSLGGHVFLVCYLFVVMDESPSWARIKKLAVLLPSPVAVSIFSSVLSLLPGFKSQHYLAASLLIMLMCTLWCRWAWRLRLLQAYSAICIAGIFQMATSILSQSVFLLLPDSPIHFASTLLVHCLITAIAIPLLKRLRFGHYFRLLLEEEDKPHRTALLLFALEIAMESFLLLQPGVQPGYLAQYYSLSIVLVGLIAGLTAHIARQIDAARRLQAQQETIAQQRLYEQDLEKIRQEVYAFRHDYKNLLSSLSRQAEDGEMEQLCAALAQLDANFDRRIGEKIQASAQTGNLRIPQVRSLLLVKLAAMAEKGVDCRLEVLYPVEAVAMDVWDFVRCLGILVDNALEAALETERPWVEIILLSQGGRTALRVSNPWNGAADPARFWEEGWSTRGAGRGVGLSSYQRLLADCPHAVSAASWADGVFVQELTIGGTL